MDGTTTTQLAMAACGAAHNPWCFFILFPTWRRSLIAPNQEQQCFQKAFTESWELHRHQIHSGISYSGEEDGLKMWRMSAGRSETERKERRRSREERDTLPSHLISPPPLNLGSTLFHLWRGWDRTSWRQHAKLNSKTTLLDRGMLYPWIRLHGDCEWIILWSLIKEKVWILKWAAECVYMQKELIQAAVYMTTACNPVRGYSASFHEEFCLFVLPWKTAQMNVL